MQRRRDIQALRQRNRVIFQAFRKVGDQRYDENEHLLRQNLPLFLRFCGHTIGQCSLEYALCLLETSTRATAESDARRASAIIQRCTEFQETRPSSRWFGNFRWMAHWPDVLDSNAVSFMTPTLSCLWMRHRDRLTRPCQRRLLRALRLATHGIRSRQVTWQYTNIFLLNIQSALLLGKILGERSLTTRASQHWQEWWNGTQREGLHEYNSPTYIPVSVSALMGIWEQAPSAQVRREAEQALEQMLGDFAMNYHAESGYLTGPMSRAYPHDYLTGDCFGATLAHQQFGEPLRLVPWEGTLPAIFAEHTYIAPASIRRLAVRKRYPVVVRRQVHDIGVETTNFLTPRYTLGAQSGGYAAVPIFIAHTGAGPRRSIPFVNDPFFAGDMGLCVRSRQVRNTVTGTLSRDLSKEGRRSLSETPERQVGLWAFLGSPLRMRVTLGGKTWGIQPTPIRSGEPLVLDFGPVRVTMRFDLVSRGAGPDTLWKQNAVRMDLQGDDAVLRLVLYDHAWARARRAPRREIRFHITVE
jgi:hypothetical protein